MGFKLTIEQGKGRGQTFDFEADEITVGRTDENDVVLYDGGVSRQHARIAFDGSRYTLSDLESANGTTLNGAKVASEVLEDGDRIGIGAVVFRFEAVQAAGGATRIVSVEQAEKEAASKKTVMSATKPPTSKAASRAEAQVAANAPSSKTVRLAALVVGVIIVAALSGVAFKGKAKNGLKPCPAMVNVADVNNFVFGRGVDADCEAPKSGMHFGFNGEANTQYVLHYAAFFVKGNELVVLVNGKKIGEAPAAPVRRASRTTLNVPRDLVRAGEKNEILFQNVKGPDEEWGLERVELEAIPLGAANLATAQEHFNLGTKLLHDKNVAAPNLYNAWSELRDARRYMEGLPDPKPDIYQETLDHIRDAEKELDALCKKQLFAAQQDAKYGKFDKANEAYKFILAAFPGDAHPCRAQAEQSMYVDEAPAE